MSGKAGKAQRGFTLLEILVALSLIGIVLVVVMQLFSANLRAIGRSDDYVNASARAEAIMRSIVENEDFPKVTQAGTTEDGYSFEAAVSKVYEEKTDALPVDMYQVNLTVRWSQGTKQRSISLQTLKMTGKKI